ncbi:MAG: hypothetical protein AABW93_00365 [Nanoarchaeota archaeon]
MKNKKAQTGDSSKCGQIGETITWVVATLIIVVILAVSLLVSSLILGDEKSLGFLKTTDVLASKSLFSYLLTKDREGNNVHTQLKNQENLNEFNGNLGKKIFQEYYGSEYEDVWVGIILDRKLLPALPNDFFGRRPSGVRPSGEISAKGKYVSSISEKIYINENKILELILSKEASIR